MRLILVTLCACWVCLFAADSDPRTADHAALQVTLEKMVKALHDPSVDSISACCEPTFSITFVDGQVATSATQVSRILNGWVAPPTGLAKVTFDPVVDPGGAVFISDNVAWATGLSNDTYTLRDGRTGVMPSRWTALVIRRDGVWRVVTAHSSVNVFDNIYLDMLNKGYRHSNWWIGICCGLIGAVLGAIITCAFVRRCRKAA